MDRDELQVIDRTYELLKWFLKRLEKFPRSHRYGLGQQIEQRLYAVFDGLMRAKYAAATDKCEARPGTLDSEETSYIGVRPDHRTGLSA